MKNEIVHYVVYREGRIGNRETMLPVTWKKGKALHLRLFITYAAAEKVAGRLGTVAPVTPDGIKRVLKRWPGLVDASFKLERTTTAKTT